MAMLHKQDSCLFCNLFLMVVQLVIIRKIQSQIGNGHLGQLIKPGSETILSRRKWVASSKDIPGMHFDKGIKKSNGSRISNAFG